MEEKGGGREGNTGDERKNCNKTKKYVNKEEKRKGGEGRGRGNKKCDNRNI